MKIALIFIFSGFLNSSSFINMFSDRKALSKGDLLSVIIVENTRANHQSQKESANSSDVKGSFSAKAFSLNPNYSMDEKGSVSSKGGGSVLSNSSFIGRITVTVEEVLGNGNLKIFGTQFVNIDGEEKKLELSGVVDPADIKENNTVYSSNIYSMKLNYDGKGVIKNKQKRSLLNFLLGWIF